MGELRQVQIIVVGDFVDLDLPMASFRRDLDGVQEISARGRHSHASVGFVVSLGPVWERQDVENSDVVLYWGRAELISVGTESDAFVQLLDDVYGTGLGHKKMRDRVPFLVVSLAGDPARLEHEPAKMKSSSRATLRSATLISTSTSTFKRSPFSFMRRTPTTDTGCCWRYPPKPEGIPAAAA